VPVHVEFFDSVEAVIEEKASLMDAVRPGGSILLYADDERTRSLQKRLPAPDARILFFGFNDETDVWVHKFEVVREQGAHNWPIGMRATIRVGEESALVQIIGSLGQHAFVPAAAAAAAGHILGVSLPEIVAGLESFDPPPGRVRLLPGIKDTLVIDDTYNASPVALAAALASLQAVTLERRKIVVLGDMLELGKYTIEAHALAGAEIAKVADLFIAVGPRMKFAYDSALESGMLPAAVFHAQDAFVAGTLLSELLSPGDLVLVKGSQSMRMERVVKEVMANPEDGEAVLVRQEKEWQSR